MGLCFLSNTKKIINLIAPLRETIKIKKQMKTKIKVRTALKKNRKEGVVIANEERVKQSQYSISMYKI